jgi:cysteine synthase A
MKKKNILNTIGKTPLIDLDLKENQGGRLLAKLEYFNPSGSIKDRMAIFMINRAEKSGHLKNGSTIIEATTGNTGISLAMIAAVKRYKMIAVMPNNMSTERQQLMKAFGARVILTPKEKGPTGAIERRNELAKMIKNSWIPGQFENRDNPLAHQLTTGQELLIQTNGKIDAFVAGIGTGGTLVGIAYALKKENPKIRIVAVEPNESAVINGDRPGMHNIQGIGEGFIPKIVDLKIIDWTERVSSKNAENMARFLARKNGVLVGISSGANVVAAVRVLNKLGRNKTVVTVLPDRGERYFSQNIF